MGGVSPEVIETEVLPVLPLLLELPIEDRAGQDFESFRFREVMTVLTLFGRRLALLDLTPTSAVAIVEAALDATRASEDPPTPEFNRHARVAAVEGFVRGREERVATNAERRASAPIQPLRIDANTYALVVSGVHEPEAIGEYVDALGRAMLEGDASIGIVDLSQLGEPSRDRARAIFAADEVVRMLGGRCIFSGVDAGWTASANAAHVDLSLVQLTARFGEALDAARRIHEETSKPESSSWRTLIERLRR